MKKSFLVGTLRCVFAGHGRGRFGGEEVDTVVLSLEAFKPLADVEGLFRLFELAFVVDLSVAANFNFALPASFGLTVNLTFSVNLDLAVNWHGVVKLMFVASLGLYVGNGAFVLPVLSDVSLRELDILPNVGVDDGDTYCIWLAVRQNSGRLR